MRSTRTADRLWDRLGDAKTRLDRAHQHVKEARQDSLLDFISTSDGHYAYRQAIHEHASAATDYLRILNDLKAALLDRQSAVGPNVAKPEGTAPEDPHGPDSLTRRELEVFTHIASGKSSREVADLLGI